MWRYTLVITWSVGRETKIEVRENLSFVQAMEQIDAIMGEPAQDSMQVTVFRQP